MLALAVGVVLYRKKWQAEFSVYSFTIKVVGDVEGVKASGLVE